MTIINTELKDTVLDNVLSFMSTASDTLTRDQIITHAFGFYKSPAILKAKEIIYKLVNKKSTRRNACTSHPEPLAADLEEIMCIFDKKEAGEISLPNFVASGYLSMPPSIGFESLAPVLCSYRDETTALRLQLEEIKKSAEKDLKALDNVGCIFQDVAEI